MTYPFIKGSGSCWRHLRASVSTSPHAISPCNAGKTAYICTYSAPQEQNKVTNISARCASENGAKSLPHMSKLVVCGLVEMCSQVQRCR